MLGFVSVASYLPSLMSAIVTSLDVEFPCADEREGSVFDALEVAAVKRSLLSYEVAVLDRLLRRPRRRRTPPAGRLRPTRLDSLGSHFLPHLLQRLKRRRHDLLDLLVQLRRLTQRRAPARRLDLLNRCEREPAFRLGQPVLALRTPPAGRLRPTRLDSLGNHF